MEKKMSEKSSIDYLLESLEDRQRVVLENYYGIGRETVRMASFTDIAKKLDMKKAMVSLLHNRAIRNLRKKGIQQHAKAISNPELFFEIHGETKECLHLKIYFESWFHSYDESYTYMFSQIRDMIKQNKEAVDDFKIRQKNGFENLTQVLKGSEFNKFIQELNAIATAVNTIMGQVKSAASAVRDESKTQMNLCNEIKRTVTFPNYNPVFDQIFLKLNKVEDMYGEIHWVMNQVLELSKKETVCQASKKRRIIKK